MAEKPEPERTSAASAGVQRIRTGAADAGVAARRTLERLRNGRKRSEAAATPEHEPTSIADDVRRVRGDLHDVGVAARRTLDRATVARMIIVAVAQVVIGVIAWRISVRRARSRRRRLELYASVPPELDPFEAAAGVAEE